ncbi:hypothetical protein ABFS83_14G239200 [Erythranthe nasuta]
MAAERYGEEIAGIIPFQEIEYAAAADFGIVDFMDNDLDHLIQLVQVQNQVFYLDTDDAAAATFVNGHLYPTEPPPPPPPPENHQLFVAFDDAAITGGGGGQFANNSINTLNNQFQNDVVSGERDDDDDDDDDDVIYEEEEESSETTTNTSEKKQKKGGNKSDRTKTLISERRRRGRMKEKLYALRALVPYITKMDKASIVGDAVLYVQDLQMQAKKLKSEIAGLESEVNNNNNNNNNIKYQVNVHNSSKSNNTTTSHPIIKKIIKMDVFQVEERGFYVRIVLKKGKGVAVLIYKAIESITTFNVQTSNLAADSDNYIFTFTLNIREGGDEVDMNLACMKLWVASLFLNQGFEFETLT